MQPRPHDADEKTADRPAEATSNESKPADASSTPANTEEQLREPVAVRILEALPFGVFVIGQDRHIKIVNQAALDIMGRKRDEILGHICHFHVCPALENHCPVLDLGKEIDQAERTLLHADGSEIPILKTVVPIEFNGEEMLLESFVNLSKRKQSEESLRHAKEHAEALNEELRQQTLLARQMANEAKVAAEAKDQFLTNMSHEIRTPLNGVMGMNQLLMETHLDDEQRSYVETIETCSQQLLRMVEDILDYRKIEAGELQLDVMNFELCTVLENLAAPLALQAQKKHLSFSYFVDPAIPCFLRGDPNRLRRILFSLIDNAVKFTKHGEVAVAVTLEEQTPTHATLQFSVRDTGIGIAPDRQEKIFDLFTQLDGSMTRQHGGAGLGLTVARQFVMLMGGDIQVDSDVGQGADFRFILIFEKQPGAAESPCVHPELVDFPVLVVDESSTCRGILRRYLESSFCRVQDASSLDEAKHILKTMAIQNGVVPCILLSHSLPDNGAESLARYIRKCSELKSCPLILLKSFPQEGNDRHVEELGVDKILRKPIPCRILLEAIEQVVESARVA